MKQIVKSPKDKQKEENKSGVYQIDSNEVINITLVKPKWKSKQDLENIFTHEI